MARCGNVHVMEKSEISRHEVDVFGTLLANSHTWMSNVQIHKETPDVAPRTIRAITLKLVRLGILEQAEVFPGHRYRLADKAIQRNRGYFDRLYRTAEILGTPFPSYLGKS